MHVTPLYPTIKSPLLMDLFKEALDYLKSENLAVNVDDPGLIEDVFIEDSFLPSPPLQTDGFTLSKTRKESEDMLEKRMVVLRNILSSEQLYLTELETLLMPLKALKATAQTSQPVLSYQDIQTVFFQVPELLALHKDFYLGLQGRLQRAEEATGAPQNETQQDEGQREEQRKVQEEEKQQSVVLKEYNDHYQLCVGDLFQKLVSQLATYRGFIDNYESAVEIVRRCTQMDQRFRTLAESMRSGGEFKSSKTEYTFEALLYKPLERVTRTTLVLHDLLHHTPPDHTDSTLLQEALRISSSFLSGLNERPQCKKAVTLSKGMRRRLILDGFVVCLCDNGRNLRHLFLYTDLLLCVKLKAGTLGRQSQYRFCWHMPLFGLQVRWVGEEDHTPDMQQRISCMRTKLFQLWQAISLQTRRGSHSRFADRLQKKLQECELWLLTHSPTLLMELHSTSGKSHTLAFSSLYELEEWREAIDRLIGENTETVPPDLLTLTSSCGKLRMTQQPHLQSLHAGLEDQCLCGTLTVIVHSGSGLQQPSPVKVCVEVDGFEFFCNRSQTHFSLSSLEPQWNQEISFEVEGAKSLRVSCVQQADDSGDEKVLGCSSLKLDSAITNKWKRLNVPLRQIDLLLSIKYMPHPLSPPSPVLTQQMPVFCIPIGQVAQQEGVLVPQVVRSCAEEVERRGLEEEGIYRTSGSAKDIQLLKHLFNTNLREALKCVRSFEVNVVSGALKLFFRDLPEPLFPAELYNTLKKTLDLPDLTSKQNALLTILASCPHANRYTLLYLLHHLRRVVEREEVNKMSAMNLATVFGPSLLRPPVTVVNISEEVVAQVQVVYYYLQCNDLPAPLTSLPMDTADEQETIM